MISPMATARDHRKNKGAAKGGFDRNGFFRKADHAFDAQFGYNRDFKETFDYCYTMKNGTHDERAKFIEMAIKAEKAEQIQKLAIEKSTGAIKEQEIERSPGLNIERGMGQYPSLQPF